MDVSHFSKGSGEEILQLVSFNLGREEFAVDILQIQEINRMVEITGVPSSPDFVEGVINLRGKVIPVVDLRKRFGLVEESKGKDTRIVVMDIRRKIIGFIVDSVSEVLRIPSKRVEPAPPMVAGIDSEYIKGVGKLDDRLLILLDVNRVLSSNEVDMLEGEPMTDAAKEDAQDKASPSHSRTEKVMEYRGLQGMVEVDRKIEDVINEFSDKVTLEKDDIAKLISHVKGILEGQLNQDDLELYGELGELAMFINETKKSLKTFDAAKITEKDLPAASDQLEGIVEATEDATNQILTAAETMLEDQERIRKIMEELKGIKFSKESKGKEKTDAALGELEALYQSNNAKLMDVMSACNFQDLTGQRIQKIITLVHGVESKIMKMILTFNIKKQEKTGDLDDEKIVKEKDMLAKIEEMELKGPKRKGEAVSQNEVDDLLGDLFG